jgi:hypothetical protein
MMMIETTSTCAQVESATQAKYQNQSSEKMMKMEVFLKRIGCLSKTKMMMLMRMQWKMTEYHPLVVEMLKSDEVQPLEAK